MSKALPRVRIEEIMRQALISIAVYNRPRGSKTRRLDKNRSKERSVPVSALSSSPTYLLWSLRLGNDQCLRPPGTPNFPHSHGQNSLFRLSTTLWTDSRGFEDRSNILTEVQPRCLQRNTAIVTYRLAVCKMILSLRVFRSSLTQRSW